MKNFIFKNISVKNNPRHFWDAHKFCPDFRSWVTKIWMIYNFEKILKKKINFKSYFVTCVSNLTKIWILDQKIDFFTVNLNFRF